jgi:two-component system nitrate/nitrite response regulator NarL
MLTTYRVLLVDDHPLLRKGVAQLIELEDNFEVVGQCSNGEQAIAIAIKYQPDVILLDLNMKGLTGIETLSALKQSGINSKIIIFSVSDHESDVLQALKHDADGYLLKDAEPDELITQLNKAVQGELVVSQPLTSILAKALKPKSTHQTQQLEQLTSRELDILKLIAAGKTNKEIANKLAITEATVKVHVKNLLKKLALKSRVEAAIWALEQKINTK